jgi:hypothetical protein
MLRRVELTMASHQENIAGERAVVRILRGRTRARQRYVLGIPLLLAGAALVAACVVRLHRSPLPSLPPALTLRSPV